MTRNLPWIAVVLVALAVGFLFGQSVTQAPLPRQDRQDRQEGGADPGSTVASPRPRPGPTSAPAVGAAAADADTTIWQHQFQRDPTDAERKRIAEIAAEMRERLRAAETQLDVVAVHTAANEILDAQRLRAEEERRRADAARGGTMALLRGLAKNPARLAGLVANRDAFAEHFKLAAAGPRVSGTQIQRDDPIPDGAAIEFPAGVHALDTRAIFSRSERFPADVVISGVGMDQTLLRIQEISVRSEIRSLTFRDLTLDCNNEYMTDLRREEPATIRLERCRVIGFDSGAGGSVMFAARTGALYASDSRFEAGYSRTNAGHGNLFRVRSGLLVRMENCVLYGPFSSIYDADSAATYHFAHCEIRAQANLLSGCKTDVGNGLTFEDCTLVEIPGDGRNVKRSLDAINPDWPKRDR